MEYEFEDVEHMWAEVENMLDSPGWQGYIIPSLNEVVRSCTEALVSPIRGPVSEDFLRGQVAMANKLLILLPMKLQEHRDKQREQIDLFGPDGQPVGTGDPYGANPGEGQPSAT